MVFRRERRGGGGGRFHGNASINGSRLNSGKQRQDAALTMSNPVLVEVLRGALVESRHRGAVAVVDADGGRVLALGDVERPVYPRSAVKALQALPLVESGAADRYGLGARGTGAGLRLALAASPAMSRPRRACWRSPGSTPSALKCGAHWPIHQPSAQALARAGGTAERAAQQLLRQARGLSLRRLRARRRPRALRRAGASGAARGQGHAGKPDRRGHLARTSAPSTAARCRPGRCRSSALARAFARFGTGAGLAPERAKAAARLRAACAAHPWHVAGTGRFCTEIMQRFGARVFVKTGAEGVYLRGAAGAGPRHRGQMRRRRRPRRRGDDGGDAGAAAHAATPTARRWSRSCGRRCATGTASRSARSGRPRRF